MNDSLFNRRIVRNIGTCVQIFALLLMPVEILPAQSAATQIPGGAQTAATQIPGGAQTAVDQCSGPLGAYIPECQAAKDLTDLPATPRLRAGGPAGSAVTIDSPTDEKKPRAEAWSSMQPIPPELPNEFQRFVASSIGEVLPVFGASLFEKVPTTFAPLDRVPVTADYVIGPGDEILLRVWGQVDLDLRLPVDRAGAVYISQVGNVAVSGMEFRQLPEYL